MVLRAGRVAISGNKGLVCLERQLCESLNTSRELAAKRYSMLEASQDRNLRPYLRDQPTLCIYRHWQGELGD